MLELFRRDFQPFTPPDAVDPLHAHPRAGSHSGCTAAPAARSPPSERLRRRALSVFYVASIAPDRQQNMHDAQTPQVASARAPRTPACGKGLVFPTELPSGELG